MTGTNIKKILKGKLKELEVLAETIGNDFGKDTIHDFRVEVKSLRSFLKLLSLHHTGADIKMTKKFKHLYYISGMLREAQLELEKVPGKRIGLPQYLDHLNKEISTKKNDWQNFYSKKIIHQLTERLVDRQYHEVQALTLLTFTRIKLAEIDGLCKLDLITDDEFHSIRKLVKDIIYLSKLAREHWQAGFKEIGALQIKPLEDIAEIIGNYNDDRIMRDRIRSFCHRIMADKERRVAADYLTREDSRLDEEKKKTIAIVRTHLDKERSVFL